jgi:hypothetical protein
MSAADETACQLRRSSDLRRSVGELDRAERRERALAGLGPVARRARFWTRVLLVAAVAMLAADAWFAYEVFFG